MTSLPERKHTRLKHYDYSGDGVYFVTTNVYEGQCLLSRVAVGRGLAPAELKLTALGEIAEAQILDLPRRYPYVNVDQYVVMPNHVHLILTFQNGAAGASPRPTLMQVVGTFKSVTARLCNQIRNTPGKKFWQDSFYESVLRNDKAYQNAWNYIDANPAKWAEDKYYVP